MAQARDEAGNIWEVDAQGNVIGLVQAAGAQAQPRATVIPQNPYAGNAEARADQSAELDRTRAGIALRGEESANKATAFDQEAKLRNEFRKLPQVIDYQTVIRQYNSALNTQPTPTGDQALITAYAKMLDPGSVVREQEFNTVAAGDSSIGQVVARLNKELGREEGGLIRDDVRQRVKQEMLNLTKNYNASYNQARREFEGLADMSGLRWDAVVGEHYGKPFMPQIESALRAQYGESGGDEAAALADSGVVGDVTDTRPNAPQDGSSPWGESLLSQGLSGINEGIASLAGLPVDAVTAGLNLVPQGINAIANTNIPTIENPILGSDWIRNQMQDVGAIGYESQDPTNQFVRRAGESVGASLLPIGATANTARQVGGGLLMGLGGGIGGATAQQVAPDNIGAEIAGELIGSMVPGVGIVGAARAANRRAVEGAVPTTDQLREQAGDLYRAAETRGVTADPVATALLKDSMDAVLQREGMVSPTGRISEVHPKAREAMQLVNDYAGQQMTPTQMQTVRSVIGDAAASPDKSERRIAKILMGEFDDWSLPLAPELGEARDVASRYLQADKINLARELGEARAGQFSGSGLENALRTEFRGLDRDIVRGRENFPDPVVQAIQNVTRGTPASNVARAVGKAAPSGIMSASLSGGIPFAVGTTVGGPLVGGAAALGSMGAGTIGRNIATKQTERAVDIAELLARTGGNPLNYDTGIALRTAEDLTPQIAAQLANLTGGYSNYEY